MTGQQLMSPPRGTAPVSQVDALLGRSPRLRGQQGSAAHGATTLLVASGRGGSGTSLVSALLAVAAAGDGCRVLLIDADDFVGPLALTLGVYARASWQDLRGGRVLPADVATPVSTTLTLVAGGAPRLGSENLALSAAERRASCDDLAYSPTAWTSSSSTVGRVSTQCSPPSPRTPTNAWSLSLPGVIRWVWPRLMLSAKRCTHVTVPFQWTYSSIGMKGAKPLAASTPSTPVTTSFSECLCALQALSPLIRRSTPRFARECLFRTRQPVHRLRLLLTKS